MLEVTVKVWGIRFVGKSVIMWTFSKLNVYRPEKRMPKQWQAYKGQKSVFTWFYLLPRRTIFYVSLHLMPSAISEQICKTVDG